MLWISHASSLCTNTKKHRGQCTRCGILLINCGQEDFTIERGMHIAQTVIALILQGGVCALTLNELAPNKKDNSNARGRNTENLIAQNRLQQNSLLTVSTLQEPHLPLQLAWRLPHC